MIWWLVWLGAVGVAVAFSSTEPAPDTSVTTPPRRIIYGGDANFPPYEFLNAAGEPTGFNIDLMQEIARDRGVTVEVRLMPWPEVRNALQLGRIDVAAMYRSTQRAGEVDFAIPHELVYHEMYIRKGSPPLRTLQDLAGKRILIEAGTYSNDALTSFGYGNQLVGFPNEPEALQALARGEGDVAIVTQTVGRPFQRQQHLGSEIAATGSPVLLSEYAFVTRHARGELIELLNEGLVAAKASGAYERIYEHWIRPNDRKARWVAWLFLGLGGTGALVVWFVLWNWVLRRRVMRQTLALRREFEERERTQLALVENERKLRQALKMETVGRLAGGIAHDFNNILTIILNYGYFLRADLVEAGQRVGDVDEILAAAERATRLTRQLLVFSRETPVERAPVDLTLLVRETLGMIQRLVGEDIPIETTLPREPVIAELDRCGIEQALLNLAANARDAMQHHGRLALAVSHRTLASDNPFRLPAGEYATLALTDSGSGIDPATLARLGEPFFTTKEAGKGTGLGLASVFATMAKHGGKVAVRSEVGRGSTFELILPVLTTATAAASSGGKRSPGLHQGAGQTVLLVEDDEALRRAAQIALVRCGYRVLEARDGEDALELVTGGARFQLLLTDVVMPRYNGHQLAIELRNRVGSLLVLYVSGYVQKDGSLDLDEPGTAFLAKPYTAEQLIDAVRRLLATGELSDRPLNRSPQ